MKIFHRMRRLYWAPLLIASLMIYEKVFADIAVVVHRTNDVKLSVGNIEQLFLMKVFSFPDGKPAKPYELKDKSLKQAFVTKVINKSPEAYHSYWTRKLFTTNIKPPQQINQLDELKTILQKSHNAIAYIDANDIDQSMRVALMIKEL